MWPFKKRLKISTTDFIKRFNISKSAIIKINLFIIRLTNDHYFNLKDNDRISIDDGEKEQFFDLKVINNELIVIYSRKVINNYWVMDFHLKTDEQIAEEVKNKR